MLFLFYLNKMYLNNTSIYFFIFFHYKNMLYITYKFYFWKNVSAKFFTLVITFFRFLFIKMCYSFLCYLIMIIIEYDTIYRINFNIMYSVLKIWLNYNHDQITQKWITHFYKTKNEKMLLPKQKFCRNVFPKIKLVCYI